MTDKPHKPRLILRDDEPRTTSLAVAEFFGKQHKDVLRAIRNLDCSLGFAERNFALCFVNSELQNGKPLPHYEMTRDGFVFLAMGFTGPEAARFKEAYIEAFNAMERALTKRRDNDLRAEAIKAVQEAVAEEIAKIRAEYATLNATQVAGRLSIPSWSTKGGYLSEAFTLMFFALERRFTDAALLWTLYDEFAVHQETRTLSARQIVEASGRALCRHTVYLSRQRLIARGLLLNLGATDWRIHRENFETMMRETQLVAHMQRVPAVQPEAHGYNSKLAQWVESTATKTMQ